MQSNLMCPQQTTPGQPACAGNVPEAQTKHSGSMGLREQTFPGGVLNEVAFEPGPQGGVQIPHFNHLQNKWHLNRWF